MKIQERTKERFADAIVYMEVYGSNRIIYRVTASNVICRGMAKLVYGVMLEDLRSGEQQSIADFSTDLEKTIRFANDLVMRETIPAKLYDAALEYLCTALPSKEKVPETTGKTQEFSASSRRIFSR